MSGVIELPSLEGRVELRGSLADFIGFRTGGPAEGLVKRNDLSESVLGTEFYPFDLIESGFRENSIPVFSVPGTEGYTVDNEAGGAVG